MQHKLIREIYRKEAAGENITVKGWVRTVRDLKNNIFIEINDGSQLANLQLVADDSLANFKELQSLTIGSSLAATGKLVESPAEKQPVELQISSLKIYHLNPAEGFPLQKKRHSQEFLREIAHLRPRTNLYGSVFRVRNTLAIAIHEFFQGKYFQYVHTPIVTASDCEGAGEMFQVTTLDMKNPPCCEDGCVDYTKDFFGKKASLTVSGQLEGELLAMGLGRVYTFGPTFRAENSNTARHLAEFWMIEPEMCFAELQDDMDLAEDFLKYIVRAVLERNRPDLEFFNQFVQQGLIENLEHIVNSDFVRLTYTEAVSILEKCGVGFEYPVGWGLDLKSEHERYLTEQYFKKPVILTAYPKEIKAFYMKLNDDGKTVAAMDVLVPGIGEIIGGSEREWRYQVLLDRMDEMGLNPEDYWWYLDTRRFGAVPHAGFGLGFERAVLLVTGMQNIRDVIPFPRTPNNADF